MEKFRFFAKTVKEMSPLFELLIVLATVVTLTVMIYGNLGNRLDAIDTRLDTMQAENNRRFDAMQAEDNRRFEEVNRRFDAVQAENNRRFDAMQAENNRRFDAEQAENNRRHDELLEVLRAFEGRFSRLEGLVGGE